MVLDEAVADVGSADNVFTGIVHVLGIVLEPQVLLPTTDTVTLPEPVEPMFSVTAVAVEVYVTGEPELAVWLFAVNVAVAVPVVVIVQV